MNPNSNIKRPIASPSRELLLTAVIWIAWIFGIVLLIAVWLPARLRSKPLDERLNTLTDQIAKQTNDRAGSLIQADVNREQTTEADLELRQSYWIDRRNTFTRTRERKQLMHHQDDGRIDFKIALFTARTNLLALAKNKNVTIPDDLGIDETLSTDTRVETALGQLSATVRLVKRILDADIQEIEHIQPQLSRMKSLQDNVYDRLREYPVEINARADFEQCLALLARLADPENGYALEHLTLDKLIPTDPDPRLSLRLVATAGRPLRRQSADRKTEQFETLPPDEPDNGPTRKSKRKSSRSSETQHAITNALIPEDTQ